MKQTLTLSAALIVCLFIGYGCVARPPVATPYHRQPEQPVDQQETTPPPVPAATPGTNPLTAKIRARAASLLAAGQPGAAAQVLERGLRIAPRDGYLWSQLAEVRLYQGHRNQALALAKKSNSLAHGDSFLQQKNRRIMALANNPGR